MAVSDVPVYSMNCQLKSGKARMGGLTRLCLSPSKAFWQFESHWKSASFLKRLWSCSAIFE